MEEFPGIPVLFISALNQTEDKIKGFRAGALDYISKPLQLQEVYARVETHLKLRRARQAEQNLLELTLNGAIRTFIDLVQGKSPELAARSRAIRNCVLWMTQNIRADERWQYDIAATLCLIGCVTLPESVFKRGYGEESASPEEEAMFRGHPESAKRLLSNIPRLEPIAEMVRLQQTPGAQAANASAEVKLGAQMLFLAIELDRRIYRGVALPVALQEMERYKGQFDARILAALATYAPTSPDFHRQSLPIARLASGMILDEDLVTKKARILILRKGTVLTKTWIEMLENFAKFGEVAGPLSMLVPGDVKAPEFRKAGTRRESSAAGRVVAPDRGSSLRNPVDVPGAG
jgi:CheY-like chemotaxis protein